MDLLTKLGMASYHPRLRPVRRLLNKWRLNRRMGTLPVDIHANNIGFFAQMNWCLYVLAYCESHGLTPHIRLTGPLYGDVSNHDWFHDFFVEADGISSLSESPTSKALRIAHIQETDFASMFAWSMTIENAHRLFARYYSVKVAIQAYVDRFTAAEFTTNGVIGMHFRGTDKGRETKLVDWPSCLRSVMKLAADRPEVRAVFVSSDDQRFVEWFMAEARGSLSVIVHPDEERSRDGAAVHTRLQGNRYRKGFEALVNSLLLSRCTALIRTTSFLSGWSSVFNPDLPITLLNEPYRHARWFPDRELIKRSDNRYRIT